ncbi:MAG: phosphoribosylformylglycinamidine synthase subunit PurS [Actinomycetota bacterium]
MGPVHFAVAVDVMPKDGISDPQGQAVERALPSLGLAGIQHVRVGKRIEVLVEAGDPEGALALVRTACLRILTNPVMEDFKVTLLGTRGSEGNGSPPA